MPQTWEQRDKPKRRKSQRDWYWKNRDRLIVGVRAWQAANPELMEVYRKRERDRRAQDPEFRAKQQRQARESYARRREACGYVHKPPSVYDKRLLIRELKVHRSCTKCGMVCNREKVAMFVWHHCEPEKKKFNLSDAANGHSMTEIVEEIEKCDLVCFNCHALIHNGTM